MQFRTGLTIVLLAVAAADVSLMQGNKKPTPGSRAGTGKIQGEVRRVRTLPANAAPLPKRRGYPERDPKIAPSTQTARVRSSPGSSPTGNSEPLPEPTVITEESEKLPTSTTSTNSPGASWVLFRNTVVATSTYSAVEPTAANDRNGILVTGNLYANTSSDNGMTVASEALDPRDEELHGGACCDQVAYAVDRGSYSLVFWLIQYWYDEGAERNALKLRMFKGRSSLLSQSETCDWSFEPTRNFELDAKTWFDFNQISHTSEFLYITTNVRDADKKNDPRVGAVIFRIGLDDLDDGNCSIDYRYWYEHGEPYISPVQNAASTMYLATHVPGALEGKNLRIYSIADGSTELEKKDKDIKNYRNDAGHCPLPDGQDPCPDQHDGRMSGFRSGSTIGWLWMGNEDGQFPFPHVRAAVFETGTLDKVLEHQIWSKDFAWQNPSVGVNQSGHLGVVLYAMGGGRFPRAQGFILDNPRSWSNIQMHAIASSTSGADGWGHYGSVRPYGNCPDTFLASVYTSEGGSQKGRLAWFGKENAGCADLDVSAMMVLPVTLTHGARLSITQTTRNIGSATAGASTVRYYLSRDTSKSSDDILLAEDTAIPALSRGGSVTGPVANAIIPSSASGAYRVLACADDRTVVSEITDTNNCFAGTQTVTVK